MYIYKGHLGGLYTSEELIEYEDLYCEECGDSDNLTRREQEIPHFYKWWDELR